MKRNFLAPILKNSEGKFLCSKTEQNKTKETALKKFPDPTFKNSCISGGKNLKKQNFLYFFKNVLSHFGMTVDQAVK